MPEKRIAVIVAHPDDEVLGFGGTIAQHRNAGDRVDVLIMATGLAARSHGVHLGSVALTRLRDQARAAAKILDSNALEFADFPDNRMDDVPLLEVVKRIEAFLKTYHSNMVYTHHLGDLNIDHEIVGRAVLTACRPLPSAEVMTILSGEAISSTEWSPPSNRFIPTEYVDIAATLERKLAALKCYANELRDWPHPRSLRGVEVIAQTRGSEAGLSAAEAFATMRRVRLQP
jgi:LmbE family N-acetylglucosaminyl deacetylase